MARKALTPDEALREARIEFGSIEKYKEEGREARGLRLIDELCTDGRFTFRSLRRNRGFAIASIATLALGIGANTAVFSVLYAVLLKPLAYESPNELIAMSIVIPQLRSKFPSLPMRAADFQEFRQSN